jgi:hypothetical protein
MEDKKRIIAVKEALITELYFARDSFVNCFIWMNITIIVPLLINILS